MYLLPVIGLVTGLVALLAGCTLGAFAINRRERRIGAAMVAGALVMVAINFVLMFTVEVP